MRQKMNIGRLGRKDRSNVAPSRYSMIANGAIDTINPAQMVAEEPLKVVLPEASSSVDRTDTSMTVDSAADTDPDGAPEVEDAAAHGLEELDPDELSRRMSALDELLDMMRPAVQMDGGDLALIDADYEAGIIEVELQGACGSCAISSTTLQGGVERLLRERLDWVTEVRGGVDDSVDPLESAALGRGAYVPRYY